MRDFQLRKDVLPKNECFGNLLSCRFTYGSIENSFYVGFALSQATKALTESIGIALLCFRPLH